MAINMSQAVQMFGVNETIWNSLSYNQRDHIYEILVNLSNLKTQADESLERLRVDSEQQLFESDHRRSQAELLVVNLKAKVSQLERDKENISSDVERSESLKREYMLKYEDCYNAKMTLETRLFEIDHSKNELSETVDKLMASLHSTQTELENLRQSNEECKVEKAAAKSARDELEGKEFSYKFSQQKLKDSNELMEKRMKWLETELETKSEELLVTKQKKSDRIRELELANETMQTRLQLAEEQTKSLNATVATLKEKHEALLERLEESDSERRRLEECFDNELESQRRLVNLYKGCADEESEKSKDLLSALDEMQVVMKKNSEHLCAVESEKNSIISQLESQIGELETHVGSLQTELQRANQQLERFRNEGITEEEMAQMAPAAAAASQLLKRGKTLSQIYSEYIDLYNNLEKEKIENRKLTESMRLILNEIEEKTPALRRQKEENVRLSATVNQLTKQMDAAMTEMSETRRTSEERTRKVGYLERENKRLKDQVLDQNRQVCTLLREIEIARGRPVADDEVTSSSGSMTSAADVITEKLLTFKDIQQLQEQNQRLVAVSRELSAKLEEKEKENTQAQLATLRNNLENVTSNLERLQTAEANHKHCLNIVTKQRDMYKVLLQCSGSNAGQLVSTMHLSSDEEQIVANLTQQRREHISPIRPESLMENNQTTVQDESALKTMLQDLQKEFSSYKAEKVQNDKLVEEELSKALKDNSELKSINARLSSQLNTVHEKVKLQETNTDNYRKEINILRDINQKYTSTIAKYEQDLANLRTDMLTKVEKLSRLEMQHQHLISENSTLRAMEKRLLQENDELRQQKHTQNMLMSNLQAIQVNLEKRDFDVKAGLENKLELLTKENEKLRERLAKETALLLDQKARLEKDIVDVSKQLSNQRDESSELRNKLQLSETEASALKNQVHAMQNKLAAISSPVKMSSTTSDDSESDSKQLQVRNCELEVEKAALENKIIRLESEVDNYKSIAESVESKVAEQEDAFEELKSDMDRKLAEHEENCNFYKSQMENMEKERQNLMNEHIAKNEEAHSMNASLRKELLESQQEKQKAIDRCEKALAFERTAKKDVEDHVRLAQEANNKYQQELILHAADVQALTALKQDMKAIQDELQMSKESYTVLRTKYDETTNTYNSDKDIWALRKKEMVDRIKDLEEQCSVLHQQIERQTSQLLVLRKASSEESATGFSEEPEEFKTSEQLLQLTRFLRREKEISEAKCETLQIETVRLTEQISNLRRQVEEAKSALLEERERVQHAAVNNREHTELIGKVEQLNLVTESNRLLRQEQEALRLKIRELESKNESLTSEIQPLSEKITVLSIERDNQNAEVELLKEEKARWKDRCQQLIENAERLDPETYKQACSERDDLQQEVEELENSLEDLSNRLDESKDLVTELQSKNEELEQAIKTTSSEKDSKIAELEAAVQAKVQSIDDMKDRFKRLQEVARKYKQEVNDLKKSSDQSDSFRQQVEASNTENKTLTDKIDSLENAVLTLKSSSAETQERLERSIAEKEAEIAKAMENLSEKQLRIGVIESQMKKFSTLNEALKKRNQELEASLAAVPSHSTTPPTVVVEPEVKHAMPTVQSVKPTLQTMPSTRPHDKQTAEIPPQPRPVPIATPPPAPIVVAVQPTMQADAAATSNVEEPEAESEAQAQPQDNAAHSLPIMAPITPISISAEQHEEAEVSGIPPAAHAPVQQISPTSGAGPSHRVVPMPSLTSLKRKRDEDEDVQNQESEQPVDFSKRLRTELEAIPEVSEEDIAANPNTSGSSDVVFMGEEVADSDAEEEMEDDDGDDVHDSEEVGDNEDDDMYEDSGQDIEEGECTFVSEEEGEMDPGTASEDGEEESIDFDAEQEDFPELGEPVSEGASQEVLESKPSVAVSPIAPGEVITLSSDSEEGEPPLLADASAPSSECPDGEDIQSRDDESSRDAAEHERGSKHFADESYEADAPSEDIPTSKTLEQSSVASSGGLFAKLDSHKDSTPPVSSIFTPKSTSSLPSLFSANVDTTSRLEPSTSTAIKTTSQEDEEKEKTTRKKIVPITWTGEPADAPPVSTKPWGSGRPSAAGSSGSGPRKPKISRKPVV